MNVILITLLISVLYLSFSLHFLRNFLNIVCCTTGLIKTNAVILNVNYLLRVIHNISETGDIVFPTFLCYGSSSSGPHLGQLSTSEQNTELVLSSFLQSNKSLKPCKCGAYHPIHGACWAYASQDTAPPSLYSPSSAACHCRWQVKVVWIHDANVW
jgi:hypothetical protein